MMTAMMMTMIMLRGRRSDPEAAEYAKAEYAQGFQRKHIDDYIGKTVTPEAEYAPTPF